MAMNDRGAETAESDIVNCHLLCNITTFYYAYVLK